MNHNTFEKQELTEPMIFDLEGLHTYYTRPMTPPGSEPLDVDRLADEHADVEFSVPIAELPRLRSRLAGADGTVQGDVHFAREAGLAVADLRVRGTATLQCQRCMQSMQAPVETRTRVALIPTEADASRVPEELEPMLAPGGRIGVRDLVEEELMLFFPIVPMHENADECVGSSAAPGGAEPRPGPTHKPFEQLQELLKRR
jgi:uncharacterized protein